MASFELKDPLAYNVLTPILHEINREVVALQEDYKRKAVAVMNEVVKNVLLKLRGTNETFLKTYKDIRWVGSYFDGLRVGEPTEFDVNIVLQFPFHKRCQVEKGVPGFVQVCAEPGKHDVGAHRNSSGHGWNSRSVEYTLKQFLDEDGYIRQDKVLAWWTSMFSKAVEPTDFHCFGGGFYKVTWKNSGPAITLRVVSQEDPLEIDIDLVPVLRFNDSTASSPSAVFDSFFEQTDEPHPPREWYIVPKPVRHVDTNRMWRLSFTDQEKVIMRGKNNLKPVNKLLKRLRDTNDWALLSSYFLKTVVLHESDREFAFYRNNLGYLLMFFMSKLKDHLHNKWLPFYWDSDMNLLAQIRRETLENMYGSVNRILKNIHRFLDDEKDLEEYMRCLFVEGVGTRPKGAIGGRGSGGRPDGAGGVSLRQQEPSSSGLGTGLLLAGIAAVGVGIFATLAHLGSSRNKK